MTLEAVVDAFSVMAEGSCVLETQEGRVVSPLFVVSAELTLIERSIERFFHAACARLAVK
jgi:hypothetical protein